MSAPLDGYNIGYLDEVITDDEGGSMFACSDTDHCERAAAALAGTGAIGTCTEEETA